MFVNGARLEIAAGSPVLEAVRKWDAAAAGEIERGGRALTDSRGLPLDPAAPAFAGAIIRVIAARDADAAPDAEPHPEPSL